MRASALSQMSPTRLLIWVHGQSSQPKSKSPRQQQPRIKRAGTVVITEQIPQQLQQWIAWLHPLTQFGNGSAAVPGLVALQQHSAICQPQALDLKPPPQGFIGPAVDNLHAWKPAKKLASEGESAAEETAAVVDEGESHPRSLSCSICLLWL